MVVSNFEKNDVKYIIALSNGWIRKIMGLPK